MAKTKMRKVGNSKAVILPAKFIDELGLDMGSDLDISVGEDGNIIIRDVSHETRTRELIEEANAKMDAVDDTESEAMADSIVKRIRKYGAMDNDDSTSIIIDIFCAYKENSAEKMFQALTGGFTLKDILEMTVLKK